MLKVAQVSVLVSRLVKTKTTMTEAEEDVRGKIRFNDWKN